MSEFSEKTLKEIEEKKICPQPGWCFRARDIAISLFFVFSLIVGACAISIIMFLMTGQDWQLYKYLDRSMFRHVMISFPYFWFTVLTLFLLSSYMFFRQTKKGYRYGTLFTLAVGVIFTFVSGLAFFTAGFNSQVHESLSKYSVYNNIVYSNEDLMREIADSGPSNGFLGGEIVDIKSTNDFIIRDFNKNVWEIEASPLDFAPCMGEKIKVTGKIEKGNVFFAESIKPWQVKVIKK